MCSAVTLITCIVVRFAVVNSLVPDSMPDVSTRSDAMTQEDTPSSKRLGSFVNKQDEDRTISVNDAVGVIGLTKVFDKPVIPPKWLRKGIPAEDVLERLHLDTSGIELFEKPEFLSWALYVDRFNIKHPTQMKSMYAVLTKRYTPNVLAKMIEAAKHKPETKHIAMNLQAEQTKEWDDAGINLGLVLDVFLLDVVKDLSQPAFNILLRYAHKSNLGSRTITFLLETLKDHLSDAELSHLVVTAKQDEFIFDPALDLQIALADLWLVRRVRPVDVFEWLGLHRDVIDFYKNAEVRNWKVYANAFRHQTKLEHPALIDLLRVHYGDEVLCSLVNKVRHDSPRYEWTTRLLHDLVVRWIGEKRSVVYVRDRTGVSGSLMHNRVSLKLAKGSPVELML
uniref:RxLR effector candidate protein n=1 Tax=Peronospora matthiolae TaxID=2874970 RepID=A0AAV1V0G7_9STRA